MRSSRTLGTQLWREVVEKLDEGVIIFNQRGVVIYGNDEAARLLSYQPRDVLELDKEDFLSLCDLDRLDGAHFAQALGAEKPGEGGLRSYELVTTARRLTATPMPLPLEGGDVTVLFLRESTHWRSDLIARAVAIEMQSPLTFTSTYSDMLMERLHSGGATPYEINDITRIMHESLRRAMAIWQMLSYLYTTDPNQPDSLFLSAAVNLSEALRTAMRDVTARPERPLPAIRVELPGDLPAVRAPADYIQPALYALLDTLAHRLPANSALIVSARNRERYVQVDFSSEAGGKVLRTRLFDSFPLVVVEQIVQRSGGRLWIEKTGRNPTTLSLALPVWSAEGAAAS